MSFVVFTEMIIVQIPEFEFHSYTEMPIVMSFVVLAEMITIQIPEFPL